MKLSNNTVKALNKHISRCLKKLHLLKACLVDLILLCWGFVYSFFCWDRKKQVVRRDLKLKSNQEIAINCLGCIDLGSDLDKFKDDLHGIRDLLSVADISFAASCFGKHSTQTYGQFSKHLKNLRIVDAAYKNTFIKSMLYTSQAGNVGICACMLSCRNASTHRIRMELVREYYMLRRMGAEYVIVYMDSKQQEVTTERNKRLCRLLLKAGVDYIVSVKPGTLDSGVTYRQKNGSVSRAVYSAGTFLSNRKDFPEARALLHIKLRKAGGKLQIFEESYYPLGYYPDQGLKNLIAKNAKLSRPSVDILANIEHMLPRLRRADKILRMGTVMELCQVQLPDALAYLQDFSVGKVCARSFEVQPGDVFFFREQFADANDLVRQTPREYLKIARIAKKRGTMLIISHRDLPFRCNAVLCDHVMEAHIAVCAHLRQQFATKTICITGSIGKTSTKDMLFEVMKMKFHTRKSEHNTNVQVWIGENIQKLDSACQVFIQETGGGRPGGASRHARMVLPEVAVITNIGDAHLGNFGGDQLALMQNKLGIIEGMPENGILYLNADDPLLVNAKPGCKTVLFAVHNRNADYYVENLKTDGNQTTFQIVHKGHRVDAKLFVPGEHNVLNAVCAFAIGQHYGIPEADMVEGISHFKTQGIRQNIVQACGMTLFLDCFNASSGSVESSSKTFRQIKIPENAKRIALLGDITGLGEMAEATHKEIAQPLLANPADVFVFYGKDIRHTYEIIHAQGLNAHYVSTLEDVCATLANIAKPGDVIMAKGSSKMQLEYVLDRVFGTCFFDGVLINEKAYYRTSTGGVSYHLFQTHATAIKPSKDTARVRVRSGIGMVKVTAIAASFGGPKLEQVELANTVLHIGNCAFQDCQKLKRVEGTGQLKYIGQAAFKNCSSLEKIHLPETLLHIDSEAFMGCTVLKELYIPEHVAQIGTNAFAGCPDLKITCKAGSYAQAYLNSCGISYSCLS